MSEIKVYNNNTFIIFATKYYEGFSELMNQHKDNIMFKENDIIIFDFLCSRGNSRNRYAKGIYKNNKIQDVDFIHISKKDDIRVFSCKFFKDNYDIVNNSILTSIQKKMILKGLVI